MNEDNLLDQSVVSEVGCYKKVRRYFRGKHSSGKIVKGLTGWETVDEIDVFVPLYTFFVDKTEV